LPALASILEPLGNVNLAIFWSPPQ